MKFGVNLAFLRAEQRGAVAAKAEELGFESVWMPDRLITPIEYDSVYPYSPTGKAPLPPHAPVMDALTTLAYVAACTSTIRLGTNVYILPMRNLFVTARVVLTLDTLSGGRAILGAGSGWMREEFELGGGDFDARGRAMDEYVQALRVLWTEEEPEFHGEAVDFAAMHFDPKPVQAGGPPILIGGEARVALRRAARLGDGWIGTGGSPEKAAEAVETLRSLRERAGRADEPFEVTIGGQVTSAEDVERYREAGVDRLVVMPWSRPREAMDGLEAFAGNILAKLPAEG